MHIAVNRFQSRGRAGLIGIGKPAIAAIETGDEAGASFLIGVFRFQQRFHLGAPVLAVFATQIAQEMQRAEDFGKPQQLPFEWRFGCTRSDRPLADGCKQQKCKNRTPAWSHLLSRLNWLFRLAFAGDLLRDFENRVGKLELAHFGNRKPVDLRGVVARADRAANKSCAMHAQNELDLRPIIFIRDFQVNDMADVGKFGPRLLDGFPPHRLFKTFAILDLAAGKGVKAIGRRAATTNEQKSAAMKDGHRDCLDRFGMHGLEAFFLSVDLRCGNPVSDARGHGRWQCARLELSRGLLFMSILHGSLRGIATLVVVLFALTSCATLNEEECRSADWRELGHQDGAAGKTMSHIQEHRRACGEHKLPVDEQQWHAGWAQGIRLYCTPENGLLQGKQGRNYRNSCPADLNAGFESAYMVAKALYDARSARDTAQRDMDSLFDDLRRAEKPEERKRIEYEIDSKRWALRSAERRVYDAEGDYDVYVSSRGLMSRR